MSKSYNKDYTFDALIQSADIIYNLYRKNFYNLMAPPYDVHPWIKRNYERNKLTHNIENIFDVNIIWNDLIVNNSVYINHNIHVICKSARHAFVKYSYEYSPISMNYWWEQYTNTLNRYNDALAYNNKHIKIIRDQLIVADKFYKQYKNACDHSNRLINLYNINDA